MASSRRDVNLVVRAKDEASKAVDNITEAFKALVGSTEGIQKSGAKTSTALGSLGKALADLEKNFRGNSAPAKLAADLTKATAAVDRLKTGVASTQGELANLAKAQRNASAEAERLSTKTDGANRALAKQGAAVDRAKVAVQDHARVVKESEAAISQFATQQKNLPSKIESASAALTKAEERYTRLGAAVEKSAKPSATLKDRFEKSSVAVEKAAAKVEKYTAALAGANAGSEAAKAVLQGQQAALAQVTAQADKQAGVYSKIAENAKALGATLKSASVNENQLASAVDKTAGTLAKQNEALNKGEVEFEQFALAAGKADLAVKEFASAGRGALTTAVNQQAAALATTRNELKANEATVREYARTLAATNEPSGKLVRDLAEARAASTTLRGEIGAQESALRSMQSTLKATATDYDAIVAAQRKFSGIKAEAGSQVSSLRGGTELAKTLEATRLAASRAAVDLDKAKSAAAEMGATFARVGPPTREEATAMDLVRVSVANTRAALQANAQAAGALSGVYEKARSGTITFEAAQRQASGVTGTLTATLGRLKAEIKQVSSAASSARLGSIVPPSAPAQVNSLAQAFRNLFSAQRESLSLGGRIQAQAIALTSAYVGLYGAIGGIKKTTEAYAALQTATSRLNVVFNGDSTKVGTELDFIRRTADRLKISFATLADNYTQFAVAAKGTNLEGANTRKIFTSISEAARVFKLDNEQVKGVFTALTQIVSKGTVQMEELRQQLGDRLPGAIQIMAAALGYGQDQMQQFFKDITAGKVSSDALIKFADELDRRVGDQLPSALQQASASFSDFGNAAYQTFLRLANGGFVEALSKLVTDFNEQLRSPEFQSFIDRVSAGLSGLTQVVGAFVSNFRLVGTVIAGFVGLKLGAWAVAAYKAFELLSARLVTARAAMTGASTATRTASTSLQQFEASATGAKVATYGLVAAVKALGVATLVGIAITAVTTAIGYFLTASTTLNDAIDESDKLLDKVKNAFEKAGGSVDEFRAKLQGVTITELQQSLAKLRTELQGLKDDLNGFSFEKLQAKRSAFNIFTGTDEAKKQYNAVESLTEAYQTGQSTAEDYAAALDKIGQSAATDEIKNYVGGILSALGPIKDLGERTKQTEQAITGLTGSSDDAKTALEDMTGSAIKMGAAGAEAAQAFAEKLNDLKKLIPGLKAQLDDLADQKKLKDAIDGLGMGPYTQEQQSLIDQATGATAIGGSFEKVADSVIKASDGLEASAKLIRDKESFKATPYYDVNAFRVGFGSDTVTLADGSIKKVVQGMRVSVADANRDLTRRIGEFQNTVKRQIGGDTFAGMAPGQQAALTSIAYNYGSLPDRLVKAIKTGSDSAIVGAIRALGNDNGGINRNRRNQEAGIYASAGSPENRSKNVEDQVKEADKANEKQAKADEAKQARLETYNTALAERLSQGDVEAGNAGRLTKEATIQKALADETAKAKKAGRDLTAEETKRITEATGAEYDRLAAIRNEKDEKKKLADAEKRVTDLLTQQTQLQEQLKIYKGQGDSGKVAETEAALQTVNSQLQAAINNATTMWQTIGGEGADAAIAKLKTTSLTTQAAANQATIFGVKWSSIGDLFTNGLTNAFDSFAKSVAEGKNIGEAARDAFLQFASDFLRQIAQMIIKQAILNALSSFGLGGGLGGVTAGVAHGGAKVGAGMGTNRSRRVDPRVFANAPRFHAGGLPGIKPDEVPAILQRGEEVLSKDSPRNIMNGSGGDGAATAAPAQVKVVNTFDAGSFISEGLGSTEGTQSFMNFVRANKQAIRGVLG